MMDGKVTGVLHIPFFRSPYPCVITLMPLPNVGANDGVRKKLGADCSCRVVPVLCPCCSIESGWTVRWCGKRKVSAKCSPDVPIQSGCQRKGFVWWPQGQVVAAYWGFHEERWLVEIEKGSLSTAYPLAGWSRVENKIRIFTHLVVIASDVVTGLSQEGQLMNHSVWEK